MDERRGVGLGVFRADLLDELLAEEQALHDARDKAEAASEAKSRFLAHMSHEIRSPLNAVLGSLGLLLDDDLNKDQRVYAKTAQASSKILLSLINDILDFSKIEAGRVVLEGRVAAPASGAGAVADCRVRRRITVFRGSGDAFCAGERRRRVNARRGASRRSSRKRP